MAGADLILRFMTIAQLALFAIVLLRSYGTAPAAITGAAFGLGIAAYLLCPYVLNHWELGFFELPIFFACFANPVLFLLFILALFDDGFRWRLWHFLLLAGFEVVDFVIYFGVFNQLAGAEIIHSIASLILLVTVLVVLVSGFHQDMVEVRRRMRTIIALIIGGYMALVVAVEIILRDSAAPPVIELLHVIAIFTIVTGLNMALLQMRPGFIVLPVTPSPKIVKTQSSARNNALDEQVLGKLRKALEGDHIYTREGLSIGDMARHLGVQEYRLRRLINTRLGYRNFNQFLNHYRIKETAMRLRNPADAHLPIVSIALEAGYGSLGPFNRAFREQMKMTPGQYRASPVTGGNAENSG